MNSISNQMEGVFDLLFCSDTKCCRGNKCKNPFVPKLICVSFDFIDFNSNTSNSKFKFDFQLVIAVISSSQHGFMKC